MKFLALLLFPALYQIGSAQDIDPNAQFDAKGNQLKKGHIAIIAIGPKPSAISITLPDGTKGKTYNAAQYPPKTVYFDNPTLKNPTRKDSIGVRIGYVSTPQFKVVPANQSISFKKIKYETEKTTSLKTYFTLKDGVKEGSRTLFILKPSGKFPLIWKTAPKVTQIDFDAPELANKRLYVHNFSSKKISCILDNNKMLLAPGKAKAFTLTKPDGGIVRFAAKAENGKMLTNLGAMTSSKTLNFFAFYDANPKKNRGRSIAVFKTRIPMPDKIQPLEETTTP